MTRSPYGDSVERLRLALKLLDGFRSRLEAIPEGPSPADAGIRAAAADLARADTTAGSETAVVRGFLDALTAEYVKGVHEAVSQWEDYSVGMSMAWIDQRRRRIDVERLEGRVRKARNAAEEISKIRAELLGEVSVPTDADPDFVPAATFRGAKEGFVFTTGPNGTGYYRLGTVDVTRKPANRHARQESSSPVPAPLQSTASPSLGTGSSGGPYSELARTSHGFSPRGVGGVLHDSDQQVVTSDSDASGRDSPMSNRPPQQSVSAERIAARASHPCTCPDESVLAVPKCAKFFLAVSLRTPGRSR